MLSDPDRLDEIRAHWPDMNLSSMVFLPKLPEGINGCASDTRPLNISNGECRILANAVRLGFERAMSSWVSSMQRGFLPDRSLLLNVIELEHRMQMESLRGQDRPLFCSILKQPSLRWCMDSSWMFWTTSAYRQV